MRFKAALITAAALVGLATSANATTTIITYQGTVNAGSNNAAGLFGGGSLDGLAFTAIYTLTLPTPGYSDVTTYTIPGDDAAAQRIVYGNSPSNPLTASFTINNHTINVGDSYGQAVLESGNAYGNDDIENLVEDLSGFQLLNIIVSPNDFITNLDFSDPLSYVVQTGDTTTGNLRYSIGSSASGLNLNLTNTSVTVRTLADAVPEPASWALMIGGLALTGLAMRRRRRAFVSVRFA